MKHKLAGHFLTAILVVLTSTGLTEAESTARQRLEASIRFLADDLLEGRGTPGRGLDVAALYLANQLRAAGWKPGNGDSYFQNYKLRDFSPVQSKYTIRINGIRIQDREFILLPFGMDPAQTPVQYDLVFAGHGIVAPERGVDDLGKGDLKGKAVITLFGAPWKVDTSTPMGYDHALGKSIQATVRHAGLLVYVSDEFAHAVNPPPGGELAFFREMAHVDAAYLPHFNGRPTMGLGPILVITPAVFNRALASVSGATYKEWQALLSKGNHAARPLQASMTVHIQAQPKESEARNVLGILQGEDPKLRDQWVVLTAHYDHLGFHNVPPGQDGIWNGADDNASGTAAVLEIARRLAAQDRPPRRSVLILFTSGEERGLLGSAHYSSNPLIPYDRLVVNIDVDMVGRSNGTVQAIAPGCEELFRKAVESGVRHGVSVLPDQQPSWRILYLIDSYHFARFGIPIVEFFTGLHEDYHQPSDEADKIRYDELTRILEVVNQLADDYAQGANAPALQRPAWFLTP